MKRTPDTAVNSPSFPDSEIEVSPAVTNVFEALGFADAKEHQLKAELVNHIGDLMKKQKLTQTQLAQLIGIDQPKVSKLLRGHFREFSVERLLSIVNRLGYDVEVRIASKRRPEDAGTRVLVA